LRSRCLRYETLRRQSEIHCNGLILVLSESSTDVLIQCDSRCHANFNAIYKSPFFSVLFNLPDMPHLPTDPDGTFPWATRTRPTLSNTNSLVGLYLLPIRRSWHKPFHVSIQRLLGCLCSASRYRTRWIRARSEESQIRICLLTLILLNPKSEVHETYLMTVPKRIESTWPSTFREMCGVETQSKDIRRTRRGDRGYHSHEH